MSAPSDDDLARWRAVTEAATPGPWGSIGGNVMYGAGSVASTGYPSVEGCTSHASTSPGGRMADAAFIATARTALPALLDLVAEQRAEIERLRTVLASNPGRRP